MSGLFSGPASQQPARSANTRGRAGCSPTAPDDEFRGAVAMDAPAIAARRPPLLPTLTAVALHSREGATHSAKHPVGGGCSSNVASHDVCSGSQFCSGWVLFASCS